MKVAVFSDVQGNLPALEAVSQHILAWDPDLVVMAGDLVNRGPSSRDCLARFDAWRRGHGWLPVRGNHEDWVLRCGREAPTDPIDADMRRFADWTYRQIADMQEALLGWPDHLCFHAPAGGHWVHVTHGTMAGNRDGITPSIPDGDLRGKLPSGVAVFVTGHTHRPLERRCNGVHILNVGSVGSPFDGDPRASYGQLEYRDGRWHARILRLAYDRGRAQRDFFDSGFMAQGGPLALIVHYEWLHARLLMPAWHCRYGDAVRRGEIGLDRAVADFLAALD